MLNNIIEKNVEIIKIILDVLSAGIVIVDGNKLVIAYNESAQKIFNLNKEDNYKKSFLNLCQKFFMKK